MLKERYSSSEVVLVGEIMKLFISAYLIQNDTSQTGQLVCVSRVLLLICLNDICMDTYSSKLLFIPLAAELQIRAVLGSASCCGWRVIRVR